MFVFMNISTSVDDGKYRASWNYVLRASRPKYAFLATRAFPRRILWRQRRMVNDRREIYLRTLS